MTNDIPKLKKKILPILKKHKIKRAAIFGSTARGENKKRSDLDLLIEFRKKHPTLFDLGGLHYDLEKKLKKEVDVITFNSVDKRIKENILKEMVMIL